MGRQNPPARTGSEPNLPLHTPAPQAQNSAGTAERVVLIADDEEPIAEAIGLVIEEGGHIPLLAQNGQHALELARARWPALLITDWMMPVLDGLSLIQALRQQADLERLSPVPSILLTGARRPRLAIVEADAYLAKSFELDKLEALLRQFLDPPGT